MNRYSDDKARAGVERGGCDRFRPSRHTVSRLSLDFPSLLAPKLGIVSEFIVTIPDVKKKSVPSATVGCFAPTAAVPPSSVDGALQLVLPWRKKDLQV